jgi:hypothetical protein
MATNILSAFNDHFLEFVNDVQSVFPDDTDILTAKNSFLAARKANPKLIVKIWKVYVVEKYRKEIESGNIEFFINKDYTNDVSVSPYSDKITEAIDRLRDPVKKMNSDEQTKTMKYIENLTKLSDLITITL